MFYIVRKTMSISDSNFSNFEMKDGNLYEFFGVHKVFICYEDPKKFVTILGNDLGIFFLPFLPLDS